MKSIRVPGVFPPLPELRQQLRTMVTLMDEPAPALSRIENIRIPGPAGEIPARVYAPSAGGPPLPAVAYFHGGGWVQGDLETHHGLCARLARHAGVLVVAIDYRLAPEHKFPAAAEDCLAAYRTRPAAISRPSSPSLPPPGARPCPRARPSSTPRSISRSRPTRTATWRMVT